MEWQTITDLPNDWETLRDSELHSLAGVWADQYAQLKGDSHQLSQFNERLRREWSIETGILERLYTIDRGTTQLLIEQGIDAALIPHGATNIPVHELVAVVQAQRAALDGLFDFVSQRRALSTHYIRQLHQIITQHQMYVEGVDQFGNVVRTPLLSGQWKQTPNNPTRPDGSTHHYCPPLQVTSEMEKLLALSNQHTHMPPEIRAAWLHHRFTQIHPFQDGNGRVARALATLVFLQAGWFPLVINRDQRSAYLDALEAADAGDLKPLVLLFIKNAKQAFANALMLTNDVPENTALESVLDALVDRYRVRQQETASVLAQVEPLAHMLAAATEKRLAETAQTLHHKLAHSGLPTPPQLWVTASTPDNAFYYTSQILETAKQLGYWADMTRQRLWVRLRFFDPTRDQTAHVVVAWHHAGKAQLGLMVATSFIYFPETRPLTSPDTAAENAPLPGQTHRLCETPFYFSYKDSPQPERVTQAYQTWLEATLAVGLTEILKRL